MNNPFEETNRYRLEQSVLSPNLFYVASTSTPERDLTNSMWNIDQRAVLYPADIPTDENSLLTQYIYDNKINKQMSAAVEVFWSQNKLIIESPLTSASGMNSALKSKFGLNGLRTSSNASSSGCGSGMPLSQRKKHPHNRCGTTGGGSVSSPLVRSPACYQQQHLQNHHHQKQQFGSSSSLANRVECCSSVSSVDSGTCGGLSGGGSETSGSRRDQSCQTIFTFPPDLDLAKFDVLRQFIISDNNAPACANQSDKENLNQSPKKDRDSLRLNDSIRKKLFDQNSDDYSTSTATNSMFFDTSPVSQPASLMRSSGFGMEPDGHFEYAYDHSDVKRNSSIKKKTSTKKIRPLFTRRKNIITASSQGSSTVTTTTTTTTTTTASLTSNSASVASTKDTEFTASTNMIVSIETGENDDDDELEKEFDHEHDDVFCFEVKENLVEITERKLGNSSSSEDYSKIVCDIGDDLDQNDSVFLTERPASPDLSPF